MIVDLFNQINQSPYVFFFLVVDEFLDIQLFPRLKNFHLIYAYKNNNLKLLKKNKTPYYCLEENGFNLTEKNSGKLISHPEVIKYIKLNSHQKGITPAIIPFKPSAKIDFICHQNAWLNICNPSSYNRILEDKLKFPLICQKYKLPFLPFYIENYNQKNFKIAQQKFNQTNLIIQTHFGWAGKCTFSANNYTDLKDIIAINTKVKFTPYLEGYSLLNNCCLTKFGLIQSPPALQYTGIKPFTQNPFSTVGRQWPSLAPQKIQEQIKKITNNFGVALKDLGYKGFFGLDFFIYQNQVFLLECNPRLTASFDFYTQIELKNNLTPLFIFHLAEFIKLDYQIDLLKEQNRFKNLKLIGSEITQKNSQSTTIRKYNQFFRFSDTINPIKIKDQIVNKFSF